MSGIIGRNESGDTQLYADVVETEANDSQLAPSSGDPTLALIS